MITIEELINRPNIRNDHKMFTWENKMTYKEIAEMYNEWRDNLIKEGVSNKFPDMNSALLAKHIDRDILYKLLSGEYKTKDIIKLPLKI